MIFKFNPTNAMNWIIFLLIWEAPIFALFITQKASRMEIRRLYKICTGKTPVTKDDMGTLRIFATAIILGWFVSIPLWISEWVQKKSPKKPPHSQ